MNKMTGFIKNLQPVLTWNLHFK